MAIHLPRNVFMVVPLDGRLIEIRSLQPLHHAHYELEGTRVLVQHLSDLDGVEQVTAARYTLLVSLAEHITTVARVVDQILVEVFHEPAVSYALDRSFPHGWGYDTTDPRYTFSPRAPHL